LVRVCDVSLTTPNGQTHALTLQAESLFSAAASAISEWSRLWWWDRDSIMTVRAGGQVRAKRVIDWEFGNEMLSGSGRRRKGKKTRLKGNTKT